MRKTLVSIAIVSALVGFVPAPATAQVIGPVCFEFDAFPDEFLMFFTPTGPLQFSGTGRNLASSQVLTATVAIVGNTARLGYSMPTIGSIHSVLGGANISLATGSGAGRCETVNTGLGCGSGTNVTMSLIPCPLIAMDSAHDAGFSLAGQLMGGSKNED